MRIRICIRHRAVQCLALTGSVVIGLALAIRPAASQGQPAGGAAVPASVGAALPMLPPAAACGSLRTLRLPDVRITEVVDARDSVQQREALRLRDNVRGPHCRVTGVTGKAILFVVVLPDQWNQRLYMGGNGGFAGTLARAALANANAGYVSVTTNTGHENGPDDGGARWALNDPERQLDYGHVAVHRTVEVAKVIAKAYYGAEPKYSYFVGCSNGGRQGLMEAQRYPDDFDGIVAGAPAGPNSRIAGSFLKNIQATFPDPKAFDRPLVTQANLDLVSAAVLEACDAMDGVKDGVLDDARQCQFKLATIKSCPAKRPGHDCLTAAQRAAIVRVYAPHTDTSGKVLYPGQPFGGENLAGGWPAWITGSDTGLMRRMKLPNAQVMFASEGGKYLFASDSTWDYSTYDLSNWARDSRHASTFLNADNPDITKFAARNGKLLLWHGWADPAINALGTIEYYEAVRARDPKAADYLRLTMLPGVLHCAGGNGPAQVPWLRAISDWVERGQAPEQLIATKRDTTGKVVRTRPVCAFPQRAVYKGEGSTDDAANFSCRMPG